MDKLLYFPYINLPETDWTVRTLLYYETIGTIVPQEYFYSPERNFEPFMLELIRSELVVPINPIEVLEKPWEVSKPFIKFLKKNEKRLIKKRESFQLGRTGKIHIGKFSPARIHADKFDGEIFYQLEQLGLAERDNEQWYSVEKNTANHLMNYLATIISTKLEMLPTTDKFKKSYYGYKDIVENKKRQTILSNLIPFPEEIDLNKILRFKEKHSDLLKDFKNKVEQLVLDENLINGTDLFKLKIEELRIRKDELSKKMNESQIQNIIFGSACGIVGAVQGLSTEETTGALIGALPGFVSAVHSALKIEKAENLFDQSGMKYLALVDKRIRG